MARLEEERGPILVEEYARLVVAAERNKRDELLAALTLPREAMMRTERVWLQRSMADASLAQKTRRAVTTARQTY